MDLDPGRIGIILTDRDRDRHLGPVDPDLYPFHPNVKLLFPKKFQAVENTEKCDTYDDDGNEKGKTV